MNKKRLLCLLTSVCLGAAMCARPAMAYTDVEQDDAFYEAVQQAGQYGLMNGTGEELFEPDEAVSRAMLVTILGRVLGAPISQYQQPSGFSDMVQGSWYAPFVAWAADCGIASGVGGGLFEPERTVTRQEAAVFILRAYNEAGLGPQGAWSIRLDYSDLADVDQWAYEGVSYCTLKEVMGDIDGRFEPDSAVSRGDAAVMAIALFDDVTAGLYEKAVTDAVDAEPDEVYPLVTLVPGEPMATWNEDGRVLLLTWHDEPESYPQGQDVTLENSEVWTFTDGEIRSWYQSEGQDAASVVLRLEQLIGLPRDSGYTHVSALWVQPEDLLRPAYCTDAADEHMDNYFSGQTDSDYLTWFEANIEWSYTQSAYPWTRLGYTYDWSLYGDEYGLTEFIICPGSEVTVEFTQSTQEFINWLVQQQ